MGSIIVSYCCLVLIWSTTSLGIVWSSEGNDVWFSLLLRTCLALLFAFILLKIFRQKFRLDAYALNAYLPSAVGLSFGIGASYYASQSIPSGILTVIWGITPVFVALLEWLFLRDSTALGKKLISALIGVIGLSVLFVESTGTLNAHFSHFVAALVGVAIYSITAVWYRSLKSVLSPLQVASGSLFVALPCIVIAWGLWGSLDVHIPPQRAVSALLYLAMFGSLLAVVLYSSLLNKIDASKVTTAFLITPILALTWGVILNGEQITTRVVIGTAIVLAALVIFFLPRRKLVLSKLAD